MYGEIQYIMNGVHNKHKSNFFSASFFRAPPFPFFYFDVLPFTIVIYPIKSFNTFHLMFVTSILR